MSSLGLALTKNFLAKHTKLRPSHAIVLGSGLASAVDWLQVETTLSYASIPNFPHGSVSGHAQNLIVGKTPGGVAVAVFAGRAHFYEGASMREAAYPAVVAHALGATTLVVTNAAGGLNADFDAGDLMLVRDHLNLMGDNPLRGAEVLKGTQRFVSMRDAYDVGLLGEALASAKRHGIALPMGVYAAMSGPAFETEAELRMLYALGADAVGMSTVPEVMAARQLGMRVLGLSVISNDAFPRRRRQPAEQSHEEILKVVERSCPSVRSIVLDVIEHRA
ncbi:MAG TPA: purine-nucleoside phosphorylase [Candidatus Acidoferrales bacterium]|nr:purine-nucleoside phosphorylase [Candidatus Acidoferrales bacterium]